MVIEVHESSSRPARKLAGRPAASSAFEWTVVGGGLWMMLGAFLDAWSHQHFRIDTFFNPAHGLLYAGMGALTIFLLAAATRNIAAGYAWRRCLPAGYGLSLVGVIGFGAAGTCDLAWHAAFGFDGGFAGGVSPPHLALGSCGVMAAVGPLRSAWHSQVRRAPWTAVASAGYLLFLLSDLTQWANPFNDPYAAGVGPAGSAYGAQALGLASFLIQGALMTGVLFYLLRRFDLPPGAALLLLTASGFCMAALKDHEVFAVAGAIGGATAEVLLSWRRPSTQHLPAMRAFGILVPVATYTAYFLAIGPGDIWWSLPLWAGSICLAGIAGLLVSFLVFPPALVD